MRSIKQVVSFGDSWVYGDELINPNLKKVLPDVTVHNFQNDSYRLKNCFSGIIADHYNVPLENFGHPGASLRSTIWSFLWWLENGECQTDSLILIGLTSSDRESWYNSDHVVQGKDPDWNRYIHSSWVDFGSSIVPEEWSNFSKKYITLSQCNEVSKLNYQQTLYFFNGIATTHSLNLYQFNIFTPPVNIEVPTLLWPNKSIQGMAKVPKAPGGHPNENGHLEISKYLLNEIEFAILT